MPVFVFVVYCIFFWTQDPDRNLADSSDDPVPLFNHEIIFIHVVSVGLMLFNSNLQITIEVATQYDRNAEYRAVVLAVKLVQIFGE